MPLTESRQEELRQARHEAGVLRVRLRPRRVGVAESHPAAATPHPEMQTATLPPSHHPSQIARELSAPVVPIGWPMTLTEAANTTQARKQAAP
eukprot:13887161-Alexandrium_andersonii.AAC.1